MLPEGIVFIRGFLLQTWRLLTSFRIPGTILTPGALLVGFFILDIFIKLFKYAFGLLDETGERNDKGNNKSEVKE